MTERTYRHVHFQLGSDTKENWSSITLDENEPVIVTDNEKSYLVLGDGGNDVKTLLSKKDRVYMSQKAITEDLGIFEFKGITTTKPTSTTAGNKGDVYLYEQYDITDADNSSAEYYMYLYDGTDWVEIGNFVDIPQSNWNEDSTTVNAYIQNRPAIREGGGTNATVENGISLNKAFGNYAHAEGYNNEASGEYSHTEGKNNTSSQAAAHAEGYKTKSLGRAAHAEGCGTKAIHEGTSIAAPHAEGINSEAIGIAAHAEGYGTYASKYAHSEGENTDAKGIGSHSEGYTTTAEGDYSHAEGWETKAISKAAHASGLMEDSSVEDRVAGCKGYKIKSFDSRIFTLETEEISDNWAKGDRVAFDIGKTFTYGYTIDLIKDNQLRLNVAIPTSEKISTDDTSCIWNLDKPEVGEIDIGLAAFTQGVDTTAIGKGSVALNRETRAEGNFSFAANRGTIAGYGAAAFGKSTQALGSHSFTQGIGCIAENDALYGHAEGYSTKVEGQSAHAEGNKSIASGKASHAEGLGTIASSNYQHVQGQYNIEDTSSKYAHIVGGGTKTARKNIYTLDWDGNSQFLGTVKAANPESDNDLTTKSYVDNIGSTLETTIETEVTTLETAIETEKTTAREAEKELDEGINQTNTSLNNEVSRAKKAEEDLLKEIQSETDRAKSEESELQTAINNHIESYNILSNSLNILSGDLNNEVSRATKKEEEIEEKIGTIESGTEAAKQEIIELINSEDANLSSTLMAEITALEEDKADRTTVEAIDDRVNDLEAFDHSVFATKADLNNYSTTENINSLYVSKDLLETKGYATASSVYTKEEVDNLLTNYYLKSDIDSLIASLQSQIDELKNSNNTEELPTEESAEDPETPVEE